MSKRYSIGSLIALLILFSIASATEVTEKTFFSDDAPIEISSNKLKANSKEGWAEFEGNVIAKQGETIMKADWMKVLYDKKGDVTEIIARGSVQIKKQKRVIKSEEAQYYRKEGKIVFLGNALAEGDNTTIQGTKMVYYTADGSSLVENAKVIIKKSEERKK